MKAYKITKLHVLLLTFYFVNIYILLFFGSEQIFMNLNSGDGGGLFLDFSNLIINYQQKRSLYLTVILEGTIIQVRSVTILTKKRIFSECSLFATSLFLKIVIM